LSVSCFEGESKGEVGEMQTDEPVITEFAYLPLQHTPAHPALTPSPPDPPTATPDVKPMFDAESIPEVSRKYQRKPLPVADAVNDNQTAKFLDKDAKVAVTSKEEAFELCNLAGAKSGLEGPLREKAIAEELAMLNEAGT